MNRVIQRYSKQLIVLLILLLTTVIFTSIITGSQLNNILTKIYFNKIVSIRNSLKVNSEKYFDDKISIIKTISEAVEIKNAMEDLGDSFLKVSSEHTGKVNHSQTLKLIEKHTKRVFYDIPNSPQVKPYDKYLANNINGNILQKLFITDNPFISYSKHKLFNSKMNLTYDKVHKKNHEKFINILNRHNFYDIFLIDNSGNIVYSVIKELDFGTNLNSGIYKDSSLGTVYRNAIKKNKISFSDFKPYEPSYNKPVAFFAMPIIKNKKNIGVIAFQLSVDELNRIMTFDESWEEIGLGQTGESYLVGQDYLMRSDSRFKNSIANKYINDLSTTVGIVNVHSVAVEDALKGNSGHRKVKDYRGVEVLSAYTSINVLDNIWALAVEIDEKEVENEILKILKTIFLSGIILVILFMMILVFIFMRIILKPIENFEKELNEQVSLKTKELLSVNAVLDDYKKAIDESSIVSKTDAKGIIKYANDAFCEISGYSREELIGKSHNIVRDSDTPKALIEEIWRTILNKRVWKGVIKNKNKDGVSYIVQSTIVPILDEKGTITEFISIRNDITTLISQEEKILNQTKDKITNVPNKVKLYEDISRNNLELKLAILKINKFQEINDFYGLEKGNLLLISLSETLQRITLDKEMQLYKISPDEFVLLPSLSVTMDEFLKTVRNIIKYCDHNVFVIENDSFNISISAGISQGDKRKIIFNSEMALVNARESNRSLMVFDNTNKLEKEYENNIIMTKKIKDAIKNDDILVYGQPIKANSELGKSKYECLVRMRDNGEILTPFYFLEIAKKSRLYPTLTKIIIEKSFEFFKDRKDEFSINLSIEDILSDDIVFYLKKKLEYYKIGDRVVIELLESEGIENFEDVHDFIQEFKSYGCKIAIDDFGTGYSNFEYLMKLNIDYLKIDGSLIKNIDTDQNAQLIVELMIDFSKKMNIKVISEFVHNEVVYKKVKEMGVDYCQGYFLSEPKDLNEI